MSAELPSITPSVAPAAGSFLVDGAKIAPVVPSFEPSTKPLPAAPATQNPVEAKPAFAAPATPNPVAAGAEPVGGGLGQPMLVSNGAAKNYAGDSGNNAALICDANGKVQIVESLNERKPTPAASSGSDDKGTVVARNEAEKTEAINRKNSYKEMSDKLAEQRAEAERAAAYQNAVDQKTQLTRLYSSGAINQQAFSDGVMACNQVANSLARTKEEQVPLDHGVFA